MCISEIELEDGILVRVFMDCPGELNNILCSSIPTLQSTDDVVKNVFQTSSTPLQTTLAYCNMVLHGDHSKVREIAFFHSGGESTNFLLISYLFLRCWFSLYSKHGSKLDSTKIDRK